MKSIIWLLVALLPCLCEALDAPVVDIVATMADGDGHIHGDSVFVSLNWNPIPGADKYRIYYKQQWPSNPILLGQTHTSMFETAVPTEWGWPEFPEVDEFYSVIAESLEVHYPDMVTIPAGSFLMGQAGIASPEHAVTLTHDFHLGRTEITNQQFLEAAQWAVDTGYATVSGNQLRACDVVLLDLSSIYSEITFGNGQFGLRMAPGAAGWGFPDYNNYDPSQHPVKAVSWYGSACYCDWLSLMSGLPAYYNGAWARVPSPNNPYDAAGYRLPTEAEWEFAAQYDDERTYPWGEAAPTCPYANCYTTSFCVGWTSPVGTHPVGANGLGVQDMTGNAREWVNDWYGFYDSDAQIDPIGAASGSLRVGRGGSWSSSAGDYLPNARRDTSLPDHTNSPGLGFRVCKTNTPVEMVRIPAGQFMMGQEGIAEPEHQVTLTQDFLLGRTEVTNAQFLDALNWAKEQGLVVVVGDFVKQYGVNLLRINEVGYDWYEIRYNIDTQQFYLNDGTYCHIASDSLDGDASYGPGFVFPMGYDPTNHPVVSLTWYGAACYCDWISQMNGLPAYYNGNWSQIPSPNNPYMARGYRLPTEAEWEFAAQFNDDRDYPWGNDEMSCDRMNFYFCVGWSKPVGSHTLGSSALGLQDMIGNAGEWCNDWFGSNSNGPQLNPVGSSTGSERVFRGGGWPTDPSISISLQSMIYPYGYDSWSGFRLCRTLN